MLLKISICRKRTIIYFGKNKKNNELWNSYFFHLICHSDKRKKERRGYRDKTMDKKLIFPPSLCVYISAISILLLIGENGLIYLQLSSSSLREGTSHRHAGHKYYVRYKCLLSQSFNGFHNKKTRCFKVIFFSILFILVLSENVLFFL